jgi:disulfide bond formation protein DsbB
MKQARRISPFLTNVCISVVICGLLAMIPLKSHAQSVYADFNGDGYSDLAVSVAGEDIGSITDAGAVNVIYGSGSGLTSSGDQIWHQDRPGIEGACEAYDNFGSALATGDFNGDGYSDLAIGVSFEDVESITNAGVVNVIYGSASGLTSSGDQIWHQDSPGIEGACEAGDDFGSALTAGDFDHDGYADLAIGVSGEDVESITNAGAVNVIYGSASGLTSSGDQIWHQDSTGIEGACEAGDWFGGALAAGDFDHDGYADLAIGVSFEDVESITGAGAVNVIYGSASGLTSSGDQIWHQDSPGIEGACEAGDDFGGALTAGDFDHDGYADLAIGVAGESVGSITDAGAVNVIYGSASGLTSSGDQIWHQDSPGIEGACEAYDYFGGHALVTGDFDHDGYADLAIGVSFEDVESITDAGAVNVIYGSYIGLTSSGNQIWHQNSPGIEDACEVYDLFGGGIPIYIE